ncbi:hypothetical protein CVT24_007139, partial [Panaeolus cyanescens]
DKSLIYEAFPSLKDGLVPVAKAYKLQELHLPESLNVITLQSDDLIEAALSSLISELDLDEKAVLLVSLDAEWNVSRTTGISILQLAPHSHPDIIYIIPVYKLSSLPPSLLRLLVSDRVYKIGVSVRGDLTRLQKQFHAQLQHQQSFTCIDLREYCLCRGIMQRGMPASLDSLLEKVAKMYLSKDDSLRKHNEWERTPLQHEYRNYAALDAYASRLIFESVNRVAPLACIEATTPPGTKVAILDREGGSTVAYGSIPTSQPKTLGSVRVDVRSQNRIVVDVNQVLVPSAAMILHRLPANPNTHRNFTSGRSKVGAYSLGELGKKAGAAPFQIVVLKSHLLCVVEDPESSTVMSATNNFAQQVSGQPTDHSTRRSPTTQSTAQCDLDLSEPDLSQSNTYTESTPNNEPHSENLFSSELLLDEPKGMEAQQEEENYLRMFEAYTTANSKARGKRKLDEGVLVSDTLKELQQVVTHAADSGHDAEIYTRIKKDIFHAFHMLPIPLNHGARPAFLRALRDHIFRWDTDSKRRVEKVCREKFQVTFDTMLLRSPRWIHERVPRYVPAPSVLVASIHQVYDKFKDATDAKTGAHLFTPVVKAKADAVLELARQGYLSDIENVPMYEKSGVDSYGLQKWKCLRGTNNVEGGPHGDIYRKFGALHAGARLTTNCLTDHRTWYNLQAFAKHNFGVDWDYHHNLAMINRTSFLLNFLSGTVNGAHSYTDWINGDLYEQTDRTFGICPFPESLRLRLDMQSYSVESAAQFKLKNSNDDWLRKRQGLALPILPPTTLEARVYFFKKLREYSENTSMDSSKKTTINYEEFAKEWNRTADGVERFYVTEEVLISYSKSWEKANNIRASEDLITSSLDSLAVSAEIFGAPSLSLPQFLTAAPIPVQPLQGVVEFEPCMDSANSQIHVPASLSIHPPMSTTLYSQHSAQSISNTISTPTPNPLVTPPPHPQTSPSNPIQHDSVTNDSQVSATGTTEVVPGIKRRRVVPDSERVRAIRSCRRCHTQTCPGTSNILDCPLPCLRPCKVCHRTDCRKGVDGGRSCSFNIR